MTLIELYLDEIRRQLPPKNREDILNEIRSTLMDTLEDRRETMGEAPDEETTKAVLKEFGAPREVARQYGAQTYLIGPHFFPTYLQVLKIVLIVMGALNIFGLLIAVISQSGFEPTLFETILEIVTSFLASLFTAFGVVTLSFAVIERAMPEEIKIKVDQTWSPDDLLKDAEQEAVSLTGQAIEITLGLVFITLLNFFLDRIGIYYLSDSGWVSAPILNESFMRYIPWITATAVFDILLNLALIRKGVWDKGASIAKLLINAFKIALLIAIIVGPAVITIDAAALEVLNFDLLTSSEQLSSTLNLVLNVLLGLSIAGLVIESLKRIYQTFIKGRHARIDVDLD